MQNFWNIHSNRVDRTASVTEFLPSFTQFCLFVCLFVFLVLVATNSVKKKTKKENKKENGNRKPKYTRRRWRVCGLRRPIGGVGGDGDGGGGGGGVATPPTGVIV